MALGLETGHTQMAGLITTAIRRKFIPILRNKLRFDPFAAKGRLEMHGGAAALRWNLATDIGAFTTKLSEMTTDDENRIDTITISSVVMTVADYGAFLRQSDLSNSVWTKEMRQEIAGIFAYGGAKTRDTLHRSAAEGTTTYVIAGESAANTGTLTATDTAIAQDLNTIRGYFDRQDCDGFDSLDGNYAVFVHGEVEQDMVGDVTTARLSWSPLIQNVNPQASRITNYKGPGTLLGCAVMRTNNLTSYLVTTGSTPAATGASTTAWKCIALADHGIGKTTLDQADPRVIMKRPGPGTLSVPLDTYGTIGFKLRQAQANLAVTRALVYYCAGDG